MSSPEALVCDDRTGLTGYVNPITGEDYRARSRSEGVCAHNLWISNRTPAARWRFLTVIYPQPPGGVIPPITRLSDHAVRVGDEVITFTEDRDEAAAATFAVDPVFFRPGAVIPSIPSPPTGLSIIVVQTNMP